MSQEIDVLAGKPAPASILVDVDALLDAYFQRQPDPSLPAQRIHFGTSGHRGSSFRGSFNEWHILAITQAICDWRQAHGLDGPLYLGRDTHALSGPATDSALQVLAANEVRTRVARGSEFTPTPAISHAIVTHNRGRSSDLADGIVVTPSHNPPDNGGFKYNPANGGPADTDITSWIEQRANAYLQARLDGVHRVNLDAANGAATTQTHDFLHRYVEDLQHVIDFDVIRAAGVRMAVDPLGGAGVDYWRVIAGRYGLDLTVVSEVVDPQFAFMTVDWDGQIRMDPSSPYAMQRLIGLKDRYDIAFACDTDHDRHGVVTRNAGLMAPNHYLSVLAHALFEQREHWPAHAALGKTVVSTAMLDRVAKKLGRPLFEAPVGFKWFAQGLLETRLAFGCEESAGASVLRRDGSPWTTDKDGIVPALLAAEMTARAGRDPSDLYAALEQELGTAHTGRVQARASAEQKKKLAAITPEQLQLTDLAGEKVQALINRAPGNQQPIFGIKAVARNGWFAARPSGTEDIYKVYAESFKDPAHLKRLLAQAQEVVDRALGQP
ncbi:MAG: phosphoglucomutase (alpha-D-glucose-1,6-bisphosphate-dependent) [Ottowia sp.]|nr:phosphoglucomutase (alpha-D-glucose-1,6-bisphosphate-dependent) [Ottowia sp.]